MNRSIPALAIAGALVLGSALAAGPAQAAPADGTYYSVPFSGDLYLLEPVDDGAVIVLAPFEQWRADGFPAPRPASVQYVKYTWDSTIYGDVSIEGVSISDRLDYSSWSRAGRPAPRTDRLAADSRIVRYSGSDELFVQAGTAYSDDPDFHKLTYAEYAHLGFPGIDFDVEPLFRKLSWNPNIVGPFDQSGEIGVTPFPLWDYFARPTPQIVTSFDGDRFCQAAGSADIRYFGLAAPKGVKLSYAQWREAGSPVPARC
jgi:hypothetical protein